jgi:integrase/transposase-like protein
MTSTTSSKKLAGKGWSSTLTHARKSGFKNSERKSTDQAARNQPPIAKQETPTCPECTSQKTWKDGIRYIRGGEIQRYVCRECSFRFSETTSEASERLQRIDTKPLKRLHAIPIDRQVCVTETKGAKNLAAVESAAKSGLAGATKTDQETIKGLIAQYAYWLEKEGYYCPAYLSRIKVLAKLGANLLDPEDVKSVIAKQPWKDGTKMLTAYAYDAMAKMLSIKWTRPKYIQGEILPFIPEESELDQIIASCKSRRMAAYLQTLKETFADPGEALRLRWTDINASNNTITINHPVKGHNSRQLQVSSKLIAMLNALPKTSERIFPTTYDSMHSAYVQLRKRIAQKLQNPRLRSISFNTFRHWGATMTYHYTRNILLVQKLLGHKSIESTMKYTQLVQFKDDEFDVATATTVEEAKELLKSGFDYITEKTGIMLFRRPKKFGTLMVKP